MTILSARNPAVRILVAALAAGMLATVTLTGCSSASPAASGSHPAQTATADAATATCQLVGAALSDGPDPDSDPVGYAEAQNGLLSQIHTQDTTLQAAISKLAGAYQQFFTSNGSSPAKEAVAVASKKINSYCPGAIS
ncbi:MAG TPA: hypothetical protein VN969_40430 [Streptosporangiaceae bacterium]|nr:hypothetical protein [Streptosporangiaceae bacterium]